MNSPASTALMKTLFAELFQAERSAQAHPTREARRLGDIPPARALARIAAHAREVMPELERLAKERGASTRQWGKAAGEALSVLRVLTVDRLVEVERSYRGTLAGIRHGTDVVRMLERVAAERGDTALRAFCQSLLEKREPIVDEVAGAFDWFARHPDIAGKRALPWNRIASEDPKRAHAPA